MTRLLLIFLAITTGAYALGMWATGMLTHAGIAAAISAAAICGSEAIAYVQRRRDAELAERIWGPHANPQPYTVRDLMELHGRMWDERKPVETVMTYDLHCEPTSAYDSLGHYAAVWPREVGAPE